MIGVLILVVRYQVRPSTLARALANWRWRMNAIGASTDDGAELLALWLDAGGRRALVDLANGPRVPFGWFDK